MKLGQLEPAALRAALLGEGVRLYCGRFCFSLRSPHRTVDEGLRRMYAEHALADRDEFVDYEVMIGHGRSVRRWLRPQALFQFDGLDVFEPMPASHAYPLMEWAMNWCVTNHVMDHLTLHAAVLERGGRALVLPAPPGSGKSTLCAGLSHSGWRLLSDEVTMADLSAQLQIAPHCRPVSLKNDSIRVIEQFTRGRAVFNQVSHQTIKGNVAHMRPDAAHVQRGDEPAVPRWVVFPQWCADAAPKLTPVSRALGLLRLAENGFNVQVLGQVGFEALGQLSARCNFYEFVYSDLHDAVGVFDQLASST